MAHTLGDDPDAIARDAEIVRFKNAGLTFAEIGALLGVSRQVAHKCFQRGLRRVVEPEVAEYRRAQLDRIETSRAVLADILAAQHVIVSNGHVVSRITGTDEKTGKPVYGEPYEDDGPTIAAIEQLRKLDDQEARLLGLYPATKTEVTGSLRYEVVGVPVEDLT